MERAVLTATSSLAQRGPENARLNGKYMLQMFLYAIDLVDLFKFVP